MEGLIIIQQLEWSLLLRSEAQTRRKLTVLHNLSAPALSLAKKEKDFTTVAIILERHTREIADLHAINQEIRAVLTHQHAVERDEMTEKKSASRSDNI